jgi:hypothetical protein
MASDLNEGWSGGARFLAKLGALAGGLAVTPALEYGGWLGAVAAGIVLGTLLWVAFSRDLIPLGLALAMFVVASLTFTAAALAFVPYSVQLEGSGTTIHCHDALRDEVELGEIDERSAGEEACYKRAQSRLIIAAVPALLAVVTAIPKGWIGE